VIINLGCTQLSYEDPTHIGGFVADANPRIESLPAHRRTAPRPSTLIYWTMGSHYLLRTSSKSFQPLLPDPKRGAELFYRFEDLPTWQLLARVRGGLYMPSHQSRSSKRLADIAILTLGHVAIAQKLAKGV